MNEHTKDNNETGRLWNKVKQSIISLFPTKPLTVARNVSTGNRVHIPDTRDDAQVYSDGKYHGSVAHSMVANGKLSGVQSVQSYYEAIPKKELNESKKEALFAGFKEGYATAAKNYKHQKDRGLEKNNDVGHLSYREQHKAYERHLEKFAHKSEGKYDSAISHTGAVREATTGRMFSRVNSEEKMAKGYIADDKTSMDKRLLHKGIREKGLSPIYEKAIRPTTQSM